MSFLQQMVQNPALLITVLLTLGVVLVNGWTDRKSTRLNSSH